jgi:hypothetical protein
MMETLPIPRSIERIMRSSNEARLFRQTDVFGRHMQ